MVDKPLLEVMMTLQKTEIKYPVSQLNITAEAVQQVKQYEGIKT